MFGKQGVCQGILGANTKDELHEILTASRERLEREETRITGRKAPLFWKYVASHKEMMEKCMIGSARKKPGMPCDQFGTPLRCYTNQSESVNNKLTRQKEAIVKNDKIKIDLSKLQFTKDVWEEVDKHQQDELHMAIYWLSAEYELSTVVAHLAVPPDERFEMSTVQRAEYVQKFNEMTVKEAMRRKAITVSKTVFPTPTDVREFSIDRKTSLQSVSACQAGLKATIVTEAQNLLNCKNAIQQMPSLGVADKRKKFLVAAKTCKKGMYECIVYKDHSTCTCQCYRYNNICKHSLCVSEIEGILKEHLDYLSKAPRCSLPSKSSLVESARDAQGVEPIKIHGDQAEVAVAKNTLSRKYTTITNRLLLVSWMTSQMQNNAGILGRNFRGGSKSYLSISFCHIRKSAWMYPSPTNLKTKLPSIKFTTKYYCVKRECIT